MTIQNCLPYITVWLKLYSLVFLPSLVTFPHCLRDLVRHRGSSCTSHIIAFRSKFFRQIFSSQRPCEEEAIRSNAKATC